MVKLTEKLTKKSNIFKYILHNITLLQIVPKSNLNSPHNIKSLTNLKHILNPAIQ